MKNNSGGVVGLERAICEIPGEMVMTILRSAGERMRRDRMYTGVLFEVSLSM